MKEPNVIPASEMARERGCTTQAVYNAIARGDLNAVRMGRHWLVLKDEKYAVYQVQETGGRLHQSYIDKRDKED